MAHEECSATSVVATSPPTPTNWWPDHAAASLSSWSWQNPTSSTCDDDVSISTSNFTASNAHSADVNSSRRLVPAEFIIDDDDQHAPDSTHIWSTHLLSSVGSNGSTDHSDQDQGRGIYEAPPFDYLKKMDNNDWEFPSNPLINSSNFVNEKNLNGFNDFLNVNETQRLTTGNKLSSNWSIINGPPDSHPSFTGLIAPGNRSPGFLSCLYGLKVEDERPFNDGGNNGAAYDQIGLHCSSSSRISYNMEANDRKYSNYYYGGVTAQSPCTNSIVGNNGNYKNSMISRLSKPLVDGIIHESKPCLLPSRETDYYKKQTLQRPSSSKESKERKHGNSSAVDEGKKKRSDHQDSSKTGVKKPKYEGSAVSSAKMHAPKVKLGDKITALQQIVSPFGKTDTASVLLEAIGCIKYLQEQVQLLSNPFMKSNQHKDAWGSCLERKEKEEINEVLKFDLRSRGLCLVPISCTPQLYRENSSGSDYWTPTYRGCLYR